jgi:hypothetical protein
VLSQAADFLVAAVSNERDSTIVFPFPMELLDAFVSRAPRTPPDSHSQPAPRATLYVNVRLSTSRTSISLG